jgi:pyridoxal phosphate enzyme (YggS family)
MDAGAYHKIMDILRPSGVQLLAVSKTKTVDEILSLYNLGQRDFGENYVQEMMEKQSVLPGDIRWHFIGHLQSNKVKIIAPFVYMIQSVDSLKLLLEIEKHAEKNQRNIRCLLQIHIAKEETKFGLDENEFLSVLNTIIAYKSIGKLDRVRISGSMGMASLTGDQAEIRREFVALKSIFEKLKRSLPEDPVEILSMGMSADYLLAIEAGSTMIRIGSLIFGERKDAHK